ncbi:MAG TPA: hypothetical protein VM095_17025 [Pyrinomonadaceae bacterium]|nr:hypothetical protein [Pyrinomonadaceae bacterium]
MKSKLGIVLSLLLVLALDGPALTGKTNSGSPAFNPDGVAVSNAQQRKRQRRRRSTAQRRRPRSYQVVMSPDEGAPQAEPPTPTSAPEPRAAKEMPTMSAPAPPPSNTGTDMPMQGTPKKSAPRIKPPTVMIKPPTE